jgi:hypothetical protein
MSDLKAYDISKEKCRSYTIFRNASSMIVFTRTITKPVSLFIREGGHFHRVWDGVEMHLMHAPGPVKDAEGNVIGWCKVSWVPKDNKNPCNF